MHNLGSPDEPLRPQHIEQTAEGSTRTVDNDRHQIASLDESERNRSGPSPVR
jgi:hypothetical protein